MRKPYVKLVSLKERLRDAAKMELRISLTALDAVTDQLAMGVGQVPESCASAQTLQAKAAVRELAMAQQQVLRQQVAERQHALALTKRELRQVELLAQKHAQVALQKQTRQESQDIDDWFRAHSWEEKT
jgi:flagellar biosynthesis chaperone FliJ